LASFAKRSGKSASTRMLLLTHTSRSYVESVLGQRIEVHPLRG
jgi:hypothetical protein